MHIKCGHILWQLNVSPCTMIHYIQMPTGREILAQFTTAVVGGSDR
jgi:hypothetical protein